MTLSAIKSMFVPGAYWAIEYSGEPGKRTPYRQVHKRATSDLIWDTGSASRFYTRWPMASEIITAEPGKLVFQYAGHNETFTFTLLSGPEAEAAAAYLAEARVKDAEFRAARKLEAAQTKARLDAEARKAREDKFRNLQPVTAWELIESLRENNIPISPGTIGTIRKKIQTVCPNGWTVVHRVKPRFSYETQPSIFYMKVHDSILLQDLAEPVEDPPHDPALDHLFGIKRDANVTPQPPEMEKPSCLSALDLFAA